MSKVYEGEERFRHRKQKYVDSDVGQGLECSRKRRSLCI